MLERSEDPLRDSVCVCATRVRREPAPEHQQVPHDPTAMSKVRLPVQVIYLPIAIIQVGINHDKDTCPHTIPQYRAGRSGSVVLIICNKNVSCNQMVCVNVNVELKATVISRSFFYSSAGASQDPVSAS